MKKIVFARSIAHVLEKYLLEADTSIHWVSVVGEGSYYSPSMEWDDRDDTELGISIYRGSSEGTLVDVIAMRNGTSLPVLRCKFLAGSARATLEASHIFSFLKSLDLAQHRQDRSPNCFGTVGKHDWHIRRNKEGWQAVVDNRDLEIRETRNQATTYALEIIHRLQLDGDYLLSDRPVGFFPPPIASDLKRIGRFNIRIVRAGEKYGRDDFLTYTDDENSGPLVEFYDAKVEFQTFKNRGVFCGRYHIAALLEGTHAEDGLCLDSSVREWNIPARLMQKVFKYLAEENLPS